MIVHHSGYDTFLLDAGKHREKTCRVCGALCDVERDCRGPRSYAGAMALRYGKRQRENFSPYDRFSCPNVGEAWHDEALRLVEERDRIVSPSLRALVESDLERLVSTRRRVDGRVTRARSREFVAVLGGLDEDVNG